MANYRAAPNLTDDYERWYTESTASNRMVLSIRSGIHAEITWAMDRLCRLCDNEQFHLRAIPGLVDALFEWPEWYISESQKPTEAVQRLFSSSAEEETKRRHALEAMFILRNSSINQPNAVELAIHERTRRLIFSALYHLKPDRGQDAEFLHDAMELYRHMAIASAVPPLLFAPGQNPVNSLARIANDSSDRTLIIASFHVLAVIFTNAVNAYHLKSSTPALAACLRYLPVFSFGDKELTEACLVYLYAHLSNALMAKAFLMHPDMASTLRLLVCVLLSEQVQEMTSLEVGDAFDTPSTAPTVSKYFELTKEELDAIAALPEPQRHIEWMRQVLVVKATGEMTQVDFWNLYKDAFLPYSDQYPLLPAADIIKGVAQVFPNTHAMVLPGPPPKFVVRGVDRRREERLVCRWDRAQCTAPPFDTHAELVAHVRSHVDARGEDDNTLCLWGGCAQPAQTTRALWAHVATHVQSALPPDTGALGGARIVHRAGAPPAAGNPLPRTTVAYPRAVGDPPSASLTALLCIRILFHASFVSAEAAPRADANHFGFPGIVDEDDAEDGGQGAVAEVDESEGERRGRKAFVGVRQLLERVTIKDEALMGWINEMIDAGIYGRT